MTTEKILSTIAHLEMARGISKDVPGMAGFAGSYLRKMSPEEAALIRRYEKLKAKAWKDVAHMLETSPHSG